MNKIVQDEQEILVNLENPVNPVQRFIAPQRTAQDSVSPFLHTRHNRP